MLIISRILLGSLALCALTIQLAIHVINGYDVVNFFSYFTNLSNVFAAVVLLTAAVFLAEHRHEDQVFDVIRGASVVMMALVGIVYFVLLRHEDLGSLQPWINVVIHYVMPVVVVADWFYDPPRTKLVSRHIRFWLVFPIVYLVYSVIRGAMMGWYAYPFLDPDKAGSYGAVFAYCAGILVAFLLVGWLLVTASNRPRQHPPGHPTIP